MPKTCPQQCNLPQVWGTLEILNSKQSWIQKVN